MVIRIIVSTDTICSVVLGDVPKVFTHTLCYGAHGVADVLLLADLASDAVYDIVGFAGAAPDGVVRPTCDGTGDPARYV